MVVYVIFESLTTPARERADRVETGVRAAAICVGALVDVDAGALVVEKREADVAQTANPDVRLLADVTAAAIVVLAGVDR